MIRLHGRAVVYGELWFDEEPPLDPGVDILVYRYRPAPIAGARTVSLHSLQTDLRPPLPAIMAAFNATCRYQIRRADSKDRLQLAMSDAAGELEEFADFYDQFAARTALPPSDRHWLNRAAAARRLLFSSASRDGERLVWHAHLRSGRYVTLAASASLFRGRDEGYRSLVGRANRWLHWQDIIEFKAAGVHHYDWGGMFSEESTPERVGINNFKGTFGGRLVRAYECTLPATLRGRMWLPARDAWRRWQPLHPAARARPAHQA